MSVLKPREYKLMSDEFGAAYAKLRDSLYQDGAGVADSGRYNIQNAQTIISTSIDDDYQGSDEPQDGSGRGGYPVSPIIESDDSGDSLFSDWLGSGKITAPPGSIGRDLDTSIFNLLNSTLSESGAKTIASRQYGAILRTINLHIQNRMEGIATISAYYAAYGYDPSSGVSGDLSLFDDGMSGLDYFTADFAELSELIGNTIDESLVQ